MKTNKSNEKPISPRKNQRKEMKNKDLFEKPCQKIGKTRICQKNEQKFKKVTAKSGTDSRRKPNPTDAKKKNKEIDPNNPFAAALMDFKEKN